MSQPDDDKISICVNVSKKVANVLRDPTGGKDMSPEERNKRRTEAFDDINTCIDVLAAFASASDGFMDILTLQSKYKENK
jgi:hypothetical protein